MISLYSESYKTLVCFGIKLKWSVFLHIEYQNSISQKQREPSKIDHLINSDINKKVTKRDYSAGKFEVYRSWLPHLLNVSQLEHPYRYVKVQSVTRMVFRLQWLTNIHSAAAINARLTRLCQKSHYNTVK